MMWRSENSLPHRHSNPDRSVVPSVACRHTDCVNRGSEIKNVGVSIALVRFGTIWTTVALSLELLHVGGQSESCRDPLT
jgi:hypothetical protein